MGLARAYWQTLGPWSQYLGISPCPASGVGMRRPETLSDLLAAEMSRRGLESTYDLAAALNVAQGTAWNLLATDRRPREETIEKIARWIDPRDPPFELIRELARRPRGEPTPFTVPKEFDQLTTRQRNALLEVGWTFLASNTPED